MHDWKAGAKNRARRVDLYDVFCAVLYLLRRPPSYIRPVGTSAFIENGLKPAEYHSALRTPVIPRATAP